LGKHYFQNNFQKLKYSTTSWLAFGSLCPRVKPGVIGIQDFQAWDEKNHSRAKSMQYKWGDHAGQLSTGFTLTQEGAPDDDGLGCCKTRVPGSSSFVIIV
jgi:hypothetical protein